MKKLLYLIVAVVAGSPAQNAVMDSSSRLSEQFVFNGSAVDTALFKIQHNHKDDYVTEKKSINKKLIDCWLAGTKIKTMTP
jgi:hypothetical protein